MNHKEKHEFRTIWDDKIKRNISVVLISILQILCLYVIIRKGMPKLTVILFIIPIVYFNNHFIRYIKTNMPVFNTRTQQNSYFIVIFLLALVFYKSINLKTIFISEGIMTIPFILGMVSFYFEFILGMSIIIEKLEFKIKTNKRARINFFYGVPVLVISTFLYLVYFPGLASPDSIFIWTRVGQNIYSDAHPIIYMFLIKGLRFLWNDIAVIVLFQILLTTCVYSFVISELGKTGVPIWLCWTAAIVIPLIPANAMYTVTIWKDIPYSLGLLTLCVMLMKCAAGDYYSQSRSLPKIFLVALFTLFMRHNALFSVFLPLLVLGIYFLVKKNKRLVIKTLLLGGTLIIAYFGIKNLAFAALGSNTTRAEYTGNSFVKFALPTTIATQQIIFTEDVAGTSFTSEEKELFDKFFNRSNIAEHKEKYNDKIWTYYHKPTETVIKESINESRIEFWKYYFKLWLRFPKSMWGGYERITSINWASSGYGSVAHRGTVDTKLEGFESIEYRPIIKNGMNYTLDKLFFTYTDSALTGVFWRPAFPFVLMLLCLHIAIRKRGISMLFLSLPVLFNQFTYFIVIASQDTRYTYINFTMFFVVLIFAIVKKETNNYLDPDIVSVKRKRALK